MEVVPGFNITRQKGSVMPSQLITHAEIQQLFDYDKNTGDLIWKVDLRPRAKAGAVAGFIATDNYRRIGIKGRAYLGHRLVWLYCTGSWPKEFIDHIDGNRLNNRIENLRNASRSDNNRNVALQRNNKSGYKGVSFMKRDSVWVAQITHDRKNYFLGRFKTPEEAYSAYCAAARKLHGEFARLI